MGEPTRGLGASPGPTTRGGAGDTYAFLQFLGSSLTHGRTCHYECLSGHQRSGRTPPLTVLGGSWGQDNREEGRVWGEASLAGGQ